MSNLFLIGFMGAGKTTIGSLLAQTLQRPYLDTDDVFAELHQGMTTGEYISTYGESRFRPEEQASLLYITTHYSDAIVATGGGVPTYSNNLEIMKGNGKVIHLLVPLAVISSRLSPQEMAKRPLWQQKTPEQLQALYDARLSIYNQAHLTLQATATPSIILSQILQALSQWNSF